MRTVFNSTDTSAELFAISVNATNGGVLIDQVIVAMKRPDTSFLSFYNYPMINATTITLPPSQWIRIGAHVNLNVVARVISWGVEACTINGTCAAASGVFYSRRTQPLASGEIVHSVGSNLYPLAVDEFFVSIPPVPVALNLPPPVATCLFGDPPVPLFCCGVGNNTFCANATTCAQAGGVINGACQSTGQCLVVRGACCIGGTCSQRTRVDCRTAGGIYQSDGSVCSASTCTRINCCSAFDGPVYACGRRIEHLLEEARFP